MKQAILVLGMHRSGTSALTGVLSMLGASIGKSEMKPTQDNPKGYFENDTLFAFNDRVLQDMGSSYDDSMFDLREFSQEAIDKYKTELNQILETEFSGKQLIAIKDPRICYLQPLYEAVLKNMEYEVLYILPYRSPYEVALSLNNREGFSYEKGVMLWLVHTLRAERLSRGKKRVFTRFADILEGPEGTINLFSKTLGVTFPVNKEKAMKMILSFLDKGLKHHDTQNLESLKLPMAYGAFIDSLANADLNSNEIVNIFDSFDKAFRPHMAFFYNSDIQELNSDIQEMGRLLKSHESLLLQRNHFEQELININSSIEWRTLTFIKKILKKFGLKRANKQ